MILQKRHALTTDTEHKSWGEKSVLRVDSPLAQFLPVSILFNSTSLAQAESKRRPSSGHFPWGHSRLLWVQRSAQRTPNPRHNAEWSFERTPVCCGKRDVFHSLHKVTQIETTTKCSSCYSCYPPYFLCSCLQLQWNTPSASHGSAVVLLCRQARCEWTRRDLAARPSPASRGSLGRHRGAIWWLVWSAQTGRCLRPLTTRVDRGPPEEDGARSSSRATVRTVDRENGN